MCSFMSAVLLYYPEASVSFRSSGSNNLSSPSSALVSELGGEGHVIDISFAAEYSTDV